VRDRPNSSSLQVCDQDLDNVMESGVNRNKANGHGDPPGLMSAASTLREQSKYFLGLGTNRTGARTLTGIQFLTVLTFFLLLSTCRVCRPLSVPHFCLCLSYAFTVCFYGEINVCF